MNSDHVLTLASINIERSKHLSRVFSFLEAAGPDVVCLQEVIEEDICAFRNRLHYQHHVYAPLSRHPDDGQNRSQGLGIFSRLPFVETVEIAYAGEGTGYDVLDLTSMHSKYRTNRYVLVLVSITFGGQSFSIANTHFPWTPDGSAAEFQRKACGNLIAALTGRELVLCGDFNAPRGGEIFTRLATQWRDNVPSHYVTSIDPKLHRAGPLQLMVDGLFSTDGYRLSDVVLHNGVSDHCAITAVVHAQHRHLSKGPDRSRPVEAEGLPLCDASDR